jgi:hypothetical protein
MNPQEWLREYREYKQSRYLRERDETDLQQRFDELASNLWSTDVAGNVTPPRDPNTRSQLLRLILHVKFEQMERVEAPSAHFQFDEAAVRAASAAKYRPPQLKTPFSGSSKCLARFGKRKHIADAFDRGILRINPGSLYGTDPSLNPAQRDKELEHVTITPNEQLMLKVYGPDVEGNEVELPVQKKELFRI